MLRLETPPLVGEWEGTFWQCCESLKDGARPKSPNEASTLFRLSESGPLTSPTCYIQSSRRHHALFTAIPAIPAEHGSLGQV